MIKRTRLPFVATLLLAGCASVAAPPPAPLARSPENAAPPVTAPQTETLPVETRQVEPPQVPAPQVETPQGPAPQLETAQPSGVGAITGPVPEPVVSGNQAVVTLFNMARLDNQAGKLAAAGASLERALRIEPRNPWLWQELAQLRLAQGQYAQGISLARKSISFAGQERRLQVLNWRVIGNARVALGNPAEAEEAFKLAAELEQAAHAAEPAPTTQPVQ